MAIKKKDGTPYVFSKPNPIMGTQALWSKTEPILIHNKVKIGQRYLKTEFTEIEEEEIEEIEQPQVVKEEIKIIKKIETPDTKIHEGIIDVWCLPCVKYKDGKITYGEKFILESQILDVADLYIQILAAGKVEPKSILYPKTKDRRWWKVSSCTKDDEYYVINAVVSDYQPSFSEPEA